MFLLLLYVVEYFFIIFGVFCFYFVCELKTHTTKMKTASSKFENEETKTKKK